MLSEIITAKLNWVIQSHRMAGLYIMGLYILGFLNKDEKDGNYVILMEDLPSVNSNFLELLIRECDP